MDGLFILPTFNAMMNALSALFLVLGYFFIRKKNIRAHQSCMLGALIVSVIFLTSYLYYHYHHGSTRFLQEGWIQPVYFAILISHTILAMLIVPMIIITLRHALNRIFSKHRRMARWTWPLWLYVSISGVMIYVLLYVL
ncbi:MAG: DUF420 domain-containing protein [Chlamydiota bacterium]|nr:DUF420 domain-containing protein [Chlamydiota bacterium]